MYILHLALKKVSARLSQLVDSRSLLLAMFSSAVRLHSYHWANARTHTHNLTTYGSSYN